MYSSPTNATLRHWQRLLILGTVIATILGSLGSLPAAVAAVGHQTTSSVNLRAEPDIMSEVLLEIPEGATVEVTGDAQNGFLPVTYDGVSGFVSADYLTTSGSDGGEGTSTASPVPLGRATSSTAN